MLSEIESHSSLMTHAGLTQGVCGGLDCEGAQEPATRVSGCDPVAVRPVDEGKDGRGAHRLSGLAYPRRRRRVGAHGQDANDLWVCTHVSSAQGTRLSRIRATSAWQPRHGPHATEGQGAEPMLLRPPVGGLRSTSFAVAADGCEG